jgi:uncharacterized protein DUF4157
MPEVDAGVLERDADAFADQTLKISAPPMGTAHRGLGSAGAGDRIPAEPKRRLETAAGVSLDGIRVHTGAAADRSTAELSASAYTTGMDIVFAQGQFNPASTGGLWLLAHEVGHVLQQASGIAAGRILRQTATPTTRSDMPAGGQAAAPGPSTYARKLDLILTQPAIALEEYADFYSWVTKTNRPEQLTSTPISDETAAAARAGRMDFIFDFLQGLWIRDIITTLQVLRLSFRTTYAAIVAAKDSLPSPSKLCVDAVNDPEELLRKLDEMPGSMLYTEGNRIAEYANIPNDQGAEVADFLRVAGGRKSGAPTWSDATFGLPRAKKPAPLNDFQQSMLDFIRRFREAMPITRALRPMGPGYIYSGDPAKDKPPAAVQSGDPLTKEMWAELNTEGSASAINTWDIAKFSWGRGWAAGGDLPQLFTQLYTTDPELIDELYQAGFAASSTGGFLMVDDATGLVHEGAAALDLIRKDRRLLSFLIATGEAPAHEQGLTEATWAVLARRQALPAVDPAMREQVKGWPVSSVRFIEHCLHFAGLFNWGHFKSTGGDLAKIVTVMIKHLGALYPITGSGARIAVSYGYVPMIFADKAMNSVLSEEVDLPTDIEGGDYPGIVYFPPAYGRGYYTETVTTKGGKAISHFTDLAADGRIVYDPKRPDKSGGRARIFTLD